MENIVFVYHFLAVKFVHLDQNDGVVYLIGILIYHVSFPRPVTNWRLLLLAYISCINIHKGIA